MEDVIFYLLIIGAVIINIVNNYRKETEKNKKRDASQSPADSDSVEDSIPTVIFEEYTKEPSPVREIKRKRLEYQTLNTNTSQETIKSRKSYNNKRETTIYTQNMSEDEEFFVEEAQPSIDLRLDNSDDLKKAFVYTLIFDRKY